MKTYKAVFQVQSSITSIPTAQTLFGAFCTLIKDVYGPEQLDLYLESLTTNTPWFVHSSMMPYNLFPAPKQSIFSLNLVQKVVMNQKPEFKLKVLSDFKQYKKISYITDQIFDRYILSSKMEQLRQDCVKGILEPVFNGKILKFKGEKIHFDVKTSLQTKNAAQLETSEKELFYVKELYPAADQKFMVYFKVQERYLPVLNKILNLLQFSGLGYKKTTGMNSFVLEEFFEVKKKNSGTNKMLLSDCLPDEDIDYEKSFYSISSSIYRGSKTYVGGYCTGRYSTLASGSLIHPNQEKEFYGKMDCAVVDGKEIYHYGLGMVI